MFLLSALVAWGAARAQENRDIHPDGRLDHLVGAWDVRVTFELPDGTEAQGSAICVIASTMGGAFLQLDYESTFREERLVIRQFLGYDDRKRAYVQFQLHEGGGAATQTRHLEGPLSEDGAVLTLVGDSFDGFTGEPVRMRTVTRILDENRFAVEEWFQAPGEPDELKVVLHHARIPS